MSKRRTYKSYRSKKLADPKIDMIYLGIMLAIIIFVPLLRAGL
jgi:hypothetical protein